MWVRMGKLRIINGLAGVLAVSAGALATPAAAQYGGVVYDLARAGGEIVGAAFICGVAQERTGALGREVLRTIGALNPAEAQRAQQLYGDSVQRAAARQMAEGDTTCEVTVARFDALEAQFLPVNGQGPAPQLRYGFQNAPAPSDPADPAEPAAEAPLPAPPAPPTP